MRNHALDSRDLDSSALAFVDVDGDRDLDLVVANGGMAGYQLANLYANDGNGTFRHVPGALPAVPQPTAALGTGDLDGDGDIDLVLGNFGYGLPNVVNRILINDGRGTFVDETSTRMPVFASLCTPVQPSDATRGIVVVDVDNDRDLDLVFANWCQNRLYRNDGTGHFRDATVECLPGDSDVTNAVVAGDLDGDGDVDLVFGNAGQDRVYRNDGTGRFLDATWSMMPVDGSETLALAIGDVDGDGDLDVIAGNSPPGIGHPGRQNRLYANDGQGQLSDATSNLPGRLGTTHALALADFDEDGRLDLLVGNGGACGPAEVWFWRNAGNGTFVDDPSRLAALAERTSALAVGDVDRDGDLDVAVGTLDRERLLCNRLRHVEAVGEPLIAGTFTLQFTTRQAPGVALAYVTAGQRWAELGPLGWLGLDSAGAIELRPTPIDVAGNGRRTIAVPPMPELNGVEFFVQGLLLPERRFSNVWVDRVRR